MGKKSSFVRLALIFAAIAAFFVATSFAAGEKFKLVGAVSDGNWNT